MKIPQPLYISAAHKSSGKTTITIGLSAALHQSGRIIQTFKKGPDYIDPLWHGLATSRPCYSLDYNTMSEKEILKLYRSKVEQAEIAIIEGNLGLYDGLDIEGSNSNAAMAKLLGANIVLVLDTQGMTRGIAPLVLGYQAFDAHINIAGVILNNVGGNRHESKLRAVLEHYTDIPVIGAVHKQRQLEIAEKHLGLIPGNEARHASKKIKTISQTIRQSVNLEHIIRLGNNKLTFSSHQQAAAPCTTSEKNKKINIAIIKDEAFGFYYPSDLEALQDSGAELVYSSALHDSKLPEDIDGIFIGGGFPERHMHKLEQNQSFRQHLHQLIESGIPCYAECGGLMYLCRSISWGDETAGMVGIIDADVEVTKKPQGRGLVQISEMETMPWPDIDNESDRKDKIISAHEFHYSRLVNISDTSKFAYKIHRGTGIDGNYDAIVYKNLLASYIHLFDSEQNHWAKRFIKFIKSVKYQ